MTRGLNPDSWEVTQAHMAVFLYCTMSWCRGVRRVWVFDFNNFKRSYLSHGLLCPLQALFSTTRWRWACVLFSFLFLIIGWSWLMVCRVIEILWRDENDRRAVIVKGIAKLWKKAHWLASRQGFQSLTSAGIFEFIRLKVRILSLILVFGRDRIECYSVWRLKD